MLLFKSWANFTRYSISVHLYPSQYSTVCGLWAPAWCSSGMHMWHDMRHELVFNTNWFTHPSIPSLIRPFIHPVIQSFIHNYISFIYSISHSVLDSWGLWTVSHGNEEPWILQSCPAGWTSGMSQNLIVGGSGGLLMALRKSGHNSD